MEDIVKEAKKEDGMKRPGVEVFNKEFVEKFVNEEAIRIFSVASYSNIKVSDVFEKIAAKVKFIVE